jgi:1-acyl-sn-glycerol-3-phosphate acyltransferase
MPEAADLVLDPKKTVTYRICAAVVGGLAKILFRPSVIGADNIPLTGPVLIAPIHRSNVDFAFSLFISPRKVFFMGFFTRPFSALS